MPSEPIRLLSPEGALVESDENAAWFYPDPKPAAAQIKGHVAFWKGVTVER